MKRYSSAKGILLLSLLCFLSLFLFILFGGSVQLQMSEAIQAILGRSQSEMAQHFVWKLRMPRACGDLIIGGILGSVGSVFQAYFRNPLAEPYLVGVSSGAGLAGSLLMVFASSLASGLGLMITGVLGGLLGLVLVLWVATVQKRIDRQRLIIGGVVLGTVFGSAMTLVMKLGGLDSNQILRWMMGSTNSLDWVEVGVLFFLFVVGIWLLHSQGKNLNVLSFGDGLARRLGLPIEKVSWLIFGIGTVMVGSSVGAVGVIGFIGLVAPHLSRLAFGPDMRKGILTSALIGANLLVVSDLVAQLLSFKSQFPVGVVTSLIGAPFLLVLLRNQKSSYSA